MEFSRNDLIDLGGGMVATFSPQGLSDLQCYYEAMELFLASSHEERTRQIRSRAQDLDPGMIKRLLAQGNILLWEDYFPSELRAAVLVSVMSYFERYLNGLCNETEVLLRAPVSHRKLKGSSINRAQVFLMDVCSLSAPTSEYWERMKHLQNLRNIVVHNGGMPDTPADEAKARRLSSILPGCTYSEFGVDLDSEFIGHVFECASTFFNEMTIEMAAVCKRIKKFESDA